MAEKKTKGTPAPESPAKKGAVKKTLFAKNQTALAKAVGRTRKTIQRWLKEPDFPEPKANGSFAIAEVLSWMEINGKESESEADFEKTPTQIDLKNKKIELECRKLAHQLAVARKQFVAVVDVQKALGDMIAAAKKILLSGPSSLAPQVVGVPITEAEKLLRDWLHEALAQLSQNPTGLKSSEPELPKAGGKP